MTIELTSTRTRENRCPTCKGLLDAATALYKATPKPGDLSICVYCAALLTFNPDMSVRLFRDDELRDFQKNHPLKFRLMRRMQQLALDLIEQRAAEDARKEIPRVRWRDQPKKRRRGKW